MPSKIKKLCLFIFFLGLLFFIFSGRVYAAPTCISLSVKSPIQPGENVAVSALPSEGIERVEFYYASAGVDYCSPGAWHNIGTDYDSGGGWQVTWNTTGLETGDYYVVGNVWGGDGWCTGNPSGNCGTSAVPCSNCAQKVTLKFPPSCNSLSVKSSIEPGETVTISADLGGDRCYTPNQKCCTENCTPGQKKGCEQYGGDWGCFDCGGGKGCFEACLSGYTDRCDGAVMKCCAPDSPVDRVEFYYAPVGTDYCNPSVWKHISTDYSSDGGWSVIWNTTGLSLRDYYVVANVWGTDNGWCTGNPSGSCGTTAAPCPNCSRIVNTTSRPLPTPTPPPQATPTLPPTTPCWFTITDLSTSPAPASFQPGQYFECRVTVSTKKNNGDYASVHCGISLGTEWVSGCSWIGWDGNTGRFSCNAPSEGGTYSLIGYEFEDYCDTPDKVREISIVAPIPTPTPTPTPTPSPGPSCKEIFTYHQGRAKGNVLGYQEFTVECVVSAYTYTQYPSYHSDCLGVDIVRSGYPPSQAESKYKECQVTPPKGKELYYTAQCPGLPAGNYYPRCYLKPQTPSDCCERYVSKDFPSIPPGLAFTVTGGPTPTPTPILTPSPGPTPTPTPTPTPPPGQTIDMSNYWPLVPPGQFREYEGVASGGEKFTTRMNDEGGGHTIRFLKDKKVGYWGPGKEHNLRWYVHGFEKKANWSQEYSYATGHSVYQWLEDDPWKLGEHISTTSYESTKPEEYPAYLLFPRHLDLNWKFRGRQKYLPGGGEATWEVSYEKVNVSTPGYSGEAIRVHFVETGIDGRLWADENWYVASGMGVVQIDDLRYGLVLKLKKSEPCECIVEGECRSSVPKACTADDAKDESIAELGDAIDDKWCTYNEHDKCHFVKSGVELVNGQENPSYWEGESCNGDPGTSILCGEKKVYVDDINKYQIQARMRVDDEGWFFVRQDGGWQEVLGLHCLKPAGWCDWVDVTSYFKTGWNTIKFSAEDTCSAQRYFDINWDVAISPSEKEVIDYEQVQKADSNNNNIIDIGDFTRFVQDYGKEGEELRGDLNNDQEVNVLDFALFVVIYKEWAGKEIPR